MCLDYLITSRICPKSGYGWKCLIIENNIYSSIYLYNAHANKWMKNKKRIPIYCECDQFPYITGFHIFKTRAAARIWMRNEVKPLHRFHGQNIKVVKVKFRKGKNIGKQNGEICYIADEMFIVRPTKKSSNKRSSNVS